MNTRANWQSSWGVRNAPSGQVAGVQVSTLFDGSANAKPGTPQFAGLLSGYVVRPPWNVAGVDYPVGIYSNCTVDTSTSFITETGAQNIHINGQQVTLRTASGGTLPTGVSLNTAYFVINVSGNTYQISATSGGSAITLGGSPNLVVALKVPVAGTNCMPPGVSYSTASVSMNGNSNSTNGNQGLSPPAQMLIDAYDFSFDGGCFVGLGYLGPMLINNSYWRCGTSNGNQPVNGAIGSSPGPFNLTYCEADGNGPNNQGNRVGTLGFMFYLIPSGTFQYCWFHNAPTETCGFNGSGTVLYCVVNNFNYGQAGDHIDVFLMSSSNTSFVQQYNLIYNPAAAVSGYPGCANTAMVATIQPTGSTVTSLVSDHNTVIGIGKTGHNDGPAAFNEGWFLNPQAGTDVHNPVITSNYVDSTGIDNTGIIILSQPSGGGTVTNLVATGNISMTTGATIVVGTVGTQ